MFPFRDHNPSGKTPYVTWTLIAINITVFLTYLPLFNDERAMMMFLNDWAMFPDRVSLGTHLITPLTSMFLHASMLHIAGNMLFLYIYGDNVEDRMGHAGFALFYLACGLAAAGLHVATNPASEVPVIGASGAIAGVMGAYLLLFPKARIDIALILFVFIRVFTLPAYVVLGFWVVFQLISGFSTLGFDGGGVAYWAHIGGFLAGILLVFPLWLRLGGPAFWRRSLYKPPHKPTFETRATSIPVVRRKRRK